MFNCTSRRHFREAEIVRKRVTEENRIQKWSNVQGYYKSCDLSNSRLAHWEVSGCSRQTKTPEMCVVEERKMNLEVRREQLKNLLDGEKEQWQNEQKGNGRNYGEIKVWKNSPMMQNLTRSADEGSQHFVTVVGEKPNLHQFKTSLDYCDQGLISEHNSEEKRIHDSKLDYLMGNIRIDEDQLSKLEVVEADKFKKLINVKRMFQSLSKIDCEFKSDATRYVRWKQMCLCVQNYLRKAISFVQEIISCVRDFQMGVQFLDRLLQHEKSLQESLKVESSEDRFVRLLELTRREPNKKWFQEEMAKWERERIERMKTQEDIFSEFQLLVKEWAERNHEKIAELFENED